MIIIGYSSILKNRCMMQLRQPCQQVLILTKDQNGSFALTFFKRPLDHCLPKFLEAWDKNNILRWRENHVGCSSERESCCWEKRWHTWKDSETKSEWKLKVVVRWALGRRYPREPSWWQTWTRSQILQMRRNLSSSISYAENPCQKYT